MRVLVDSDQYAYSAGGATQRTWYDVGVQGPDGEILEEHFLDGRDAVAALKAEEWPEGTEFTVLPVPVAEPESHAIHLVKKSLNAVEKAMDVAGVPFDRLELLMTGDGNFRERIATIKGYKANRDRNERPIHYKAIRRYLTRAWGAVTVHGYEADDALSMAAHADRDGVIIVSQDKDLKNVPGRHYNARTKTWLTISEEDALVHFYRQLITGDAVDNIGSVWRAGKAKAETTITPGLSEYEMYSRTLQLYQESLKVKGCPYLEMGAEAALLENARLLHLLRHEGDIWNPPLIPSPSPTASTSRSSRSPASCSVSAAPA